MYTRRTRPAGEEHEYTLIRGRREVSSKNVQDKTGKPHPASKKPPSAVHKAGQNDPKSKVQGKTTLPSTSTAPPPGSRQPDTPFPTRKAPPPRKQTSPYPVINYIDEEDPQRDSPFKLATSTPGSSRPPPQRPPTPRPGFQPTSPYSAG